MENKQNTEIVAEAVRVEFDSKTNEVFLVFKITDENFKQRIKANWMVDEELKLDGKYLIK